MSNPENSLEASRERLKKAQNLNLRQKKRGQKKGSNLCLTLQSSLFVTMENYTRIPGRVRCESTAGLPLIHLDERKSKAD